MMTGYMHPGYVESLKEFGTPRALPRCRGWILERQIPGYPYHDAMGCYPLFACQDWSQLHLDLEEVGSELVSLALVTDPFGEYDEALDVIHFSRQHFPDESYNLRYEAILHGARGHIQEVNRVIDESFQLSGSAPGGVMLDAAKALRAHGYKEVAHEVLRRALEWYNSRITGDYRYSIAEVLYYDEQWMKAQQYFEQLYREYPDNQTYYGYTGVLAARLGEKEKAIRILEELYRKDEPYLFGSHLHWCARIAAVLGEHRRAVDLLREAYGQGRGYGIYELLQQDFESLREYEPYIELMRPKG